VHQQIVEPNALCRREASSNQNSDALAAVDLEIGHIGKHEPTGGEARKSPLVSARCFKALWSSFRSRVERFSI
jgi:hypothetical protein